LQASPAPAPAAIASPSVSWQNSPNQTNRVGFSRSGNIPRVITTLSKREQLCAIFWTVVASLQAIFVLYAIYEVSVYHLIMEDVAEALLGTAFLGIISILNFVCAYKDFKFSKSILGPDLPNNIIGRYENAGGHAAPLVWNGVLFILCIFGGLEALLLTFLVANAVAVSIFNLVGVRNYAMENREEIEEYELQAY
jgi:hypothetical protein